MKYLLAIISLLFIQNAFCLKNKYDFIIIGGGTSGSVVASRLSENKQFDVLLIEAGPNENNNPLVTNIDNFMDMANTHLRWNVHKIKDETTTSGLTEVAALRILGGGSAGNGGGYERGDPSDWDKIATLLNDDSWKLTELEPLFEKIEKSVGQTNDLGKGGVFTIDFGTESTLSQAWRNASSELGYPTYNDFSQEGRNKGFAFEASANIDGERQHAANTYLETVASSTLTVLTESQVNRIVLKKKGKKYEADSVEFYYDGEYHKIKAKHEIILSGGSIYSPFILKHSGIGYDQLSSHKYINLPGVGQNLIDNVGFVMLFANNITSQDDIDGVIPVALLNSTDETMDTFFILKASPGIFVVVLVANDHDAKGTVSLYDSNPFSMPKVKFDLLNDESKLTNLKNRIQKIREVMATESMKQFDPFEFLPGPDADLDEFIKANIDQSFHITGTCKMGLDDDPLSVVNSDFQVKGVKKLRVIDASVIPIETKMGTMATALVIGEKGADEILAQYS